MTRRRVIWVAGIGLAVLLALAARIYSGEHEMSPFDFIPEPPGLGTMRDKGYAPDVDAMKAQVTQALNGLSAAEVVDMLRAGEMEHRFVSKDLISVVPRKLYLPMLASYVCIIDLAFENGVFKEVADISGCGLVAA